MWETICDAQVHFCTHSSNSKFLSKFSRKPLSGISDQKAPPPPFRKTSYLRWPKFTPKYPPPISDNFRFEMTKVYSKIPPPPFRKTSDLRWPKFTPKYPPIKSLLQNPPLFRTTSDLRWPKVYSEIPPPPFRKTPDLRWPKFTQKYHPPPLLKNLGDRMWRLICNPQRYHSFKLVNQLE